MSIQAAKEDIKALTKFQADIHVADGHTEEVISYFYQAFIKSTWWSSVPMKLKCTEDGDEVIYAANDTFHFLMYSYISYTLPSIRVLPKYKGRARIAWPHNIGTNPIVRACFKQDDDTYHTWDNVWADIYFQFYQSPGAGKRENHNIGIGNVECLENWSESLPNYPINVDQPWFYSMDHALAFPLLYKGSQSRAEHRYTFRRKITDLLRIQILTKQGHWKNVDKNRHKYLDVGADATLPLPELWGRYAYVSDGEVKWHKTCRDERVFYTRDVEVCDTSNPNAYKSTSEVTFHSTNPCLAFFWVAENQDARATGNLSNYTTDVNDVYSGWDPIKSTTLKYGTTVRIDNMASHHFSIAEPRKHFPSAPSERGYHGYSYAWDSTSFHGDVGITFAGLNAKLICKIDNGDIFNNSINDEVNEDSDEDDELAPLSTSDSVRNPVPSKIATTQNNMITQARENSPNFITRARLLVVRKFTITNGDKGSFEFKIE